MTALRLALGVTGHRVLVGGVAGALPALIWIAGVIVTWLADNACWSGAFTGAYGFASYALYIAVPSAVVWTISGAALALDGRKKLLGGGLAGALIGASILFAGFFGMSLRDCQYWDYLDILLLYCALLAMLIAAPFGAALGWYLSHKPAISRHNFRTFCNRNILKGVCCGAVPGSVLLAWSTVAFVSLSIDYFGMASYAFLYMLLSLSLVALGGQAGALAAWLRYRRKNSTAGWRLGDDA